MSFKQSPEKTWQETSKNKSQEQVIRLTVERFTVPEILFHPSDVGISQMGLAEAIMYSVSKCPKGKSDSYWLLIFVCR